MDRVPARPFRSREWFAAPERVDMTALYLERYVADGYTRDELRCGKPIIGISQSGSDLAACNRVHLKLVERVKAGIRDAGGIPMEFPMHPILRIAGDRPPRLTAISHISAWWKSSPAIPSTRSS